MTESYDYANAVAERVIKFSIEKGFKLKVLLRGIIRVEYSYYYLIPKQMHNQQ